MISFLLVLFGLAWANPMLAPKELENIGKPLMGFNLIKETGAEYLFPKKNKITLLCPFYLDCPHTCSPLISRLLSAYQKSNFPKDELEIVLFSFLKDDAGENLRSFRRNLGIPKEWIVAYASTEETQRLLDSLDYRVMTVSKKMVDHPNVLIFLDSQGRIRQYLTGLNLNSQQLDEALFNAKQQKSGTFRTPLFYSSLIGFLLVGLFMVVWQMHLKKRNL